MNKSFALITLCFCLAFSHLTAKTSPSKVVLQLKWKHQFQFAGYYAAAEKGFYREVGIDVEFRESNIDLVPVNEVINGNAHFGIGSIEVLTQYIKGEPLVLLASIFQHSPSIFIVKESSSIFTPQDFKGKSVMIDLDERGYELISMLLSQGVKTNEIQFQEHTHSINDFLNNRVEAFSAYITNEPFFLNSYGIPFRVIKPSTYGIDFYSDCLFTSTDQIKNNPKLVNDFIAASLRGWYYALKNKEEISALILSKYNPTKSLDHLIFEANSIHSLINPELFEIGHTNRVRWEFLAELLYQNGLVDKPKSLNDFIYSSEKLIIGISQKVKLVLLFLGIAVLFAVLIIYLNVNKIVSKKTKDFQILVSKLEEQNRKISAINAELISARELAEESVKDKATFFAGLIAELKTPVDGLTEAAQQLVSANVPKDQKEILNKNIQRWSKTLNLFNKDIASILSISQPEKLSYNVIVPEEFLKNFLSASTQLIDVNPSQFDISCNNIRLSLPILIDANKISRILEILISNSLKHSPEAKIEIGCTVTESDMLSFWVSDMGKGLTNFQISQFNDFFSSPYKSIVKGVGYGLTLVKALVKLLNGDIRVSSIDSRTTFLFDVSFIPIEPLDYNENTANLFQNLTRNSLEVIKGKTILLHDHNPNNYLLLRSMLEGTGCNLVQSQSMEKTFSLGVGYSGIDVIIVSVSVLSNSEIDFLTKIRENKPSLPIIADITYDFDQKEKYLLHGFTDIIQRPNTRGQLIAKIIEYLK
jgi:ABC-type nitrate/sulfonate/bicarbonate transport system substrate-binding protein/nitrogen-specific signal transduction histidine kinase